MSSKNKLEYLKVLMNIKSDIYKTNKTQLKKDLLVIKKLLLLEVNKDNQELKQIEKSMQKVLNIA